MTLGPRSCPRHVITDWAQTYRDLRETQDLCKANVEESYQETTGGQNTRGVCKVDGLEKT